MNVLKFLFLFLSCEEFIWSLCYFKIFFIVIWNLTFYVFDGELELIWLVGVVLLCFLKWVFGSIKFKSCFLVGFVNFVVEKVRKN